MKNVVRINCKTKTVEITPEGEQYLKMGGRGLTADIISKEVDPTVDALGKENKLVFAGMLLSGTTISTANRLSVGTKSPLTGGIKEANVGGTAGQFLSAHGIKVMILEDMPDTKETNVLLIGSDGNIKFEDGTYLKDKGTYATCDILREKYGDNTCVICLGPAGDRGYLNSAIMVTEMGIDKPTRAAARGGVGAVMSSKGLKAIVIQKAAAPYKWQYVDEAKFKENSKKVIQSVLGSRGIQSEHGTAALVGITIPKASAPYRNFSGGKLTDEEQKLFNVTTVMDRIRAYGGSTGHACQAGCVVKCSNIVNNEDGSYLTAGFEYETIELAGPNCAIWDVGDLAKIDRFCDDFGFDSIELSVTLGIYMDVGKLEFSDSKGALKLFDSFYQGSDVADDFGMGADRLGRKYGAKHIPTVKKQAMAAYEPRNIKGTGTTYAISTMGADHTSGASLSRGDLDPIKKEGSLEFAVDIQKVMAACDCNVCLFAWGGTIKAGQDFADTIAAAVGGEWTVPDIIGLGAVTIELEREFNRKAGITPDMDRLPEYFYDEPSSATGSVFDIDHKDMLEKWHGIKQ